MPPHRTTSGRAPSRASASSAPETATLGVSGAAPVPAPVAPEAAAGGVRALPRPDAAEPVEVEPLAGGPVESEVEPDDQARVESFGYRRFANRELSRLDFGARLLDLSEDRALPLLERVKFMAIFSELLDEFFQVRVAGLDDQLAAGVRSRSIDGLRPAEQLRAIRSGVEVLVARQDRIFLEGLVPAL